ncbi:MAG: SBBP repeat-containing protein [Acidobacteria bacterium]|nr:SBBP repeat-containing protein [Acidobacteriota bacterium]
MFRCVVALLALGSLIFPVFPAAAAPPPAVPDAAPPAVSTVSFEENRGQFDKRVRYAARAAGTTVFLTVDEAVYVIPFDDNQSNNPKSEIRNPKSEIRNPKSAFALRMKIVGANPDSTFAGESLREQRTNYFRGPAENWRTDIPNFGAVRFENVYDGVGMLWQGQENGATRYDFTVAPNAAPERIALSFAGADSLEIDPDGSLLIHTKAGTLRQNRPFSYQETNGVRREVASGFRIEDDCVKFTLGDYDRSLPLTIDPTVALNNLAGSTLIGGFNDDQVNASGTDAYGYHYVAGQTLSPNFPTTIGVFDPSDHFGSDGFVAKFNASGTGLIYSSYIGGALGDGVNGMSVDPNGVVYLVGNTASGDFPVTAGAYDTTYNSGLNGDAFALKLNSSGSTLNFSTFLGGNGEDVGSGIAVDSSLNVYVTGYSVDSTIDFPTTAGAFDTTQNGQSDVYLAKLNAAGSALVYSTFLGGLNFDFGYGVAVDASGNAFIAGDTQSTNFPVLSAFDSVHNGADDVFVTELNPSGSALVFSTFAGGAGTDLATAIALDIQGNPVVTGFAVSGFPTTAGAYDTTYNGGFEAFAMKFTNGSGTIGFSTYLGGAGDDRGYGIAVDPSGTVFVTGETADAATDFPTTAGAYDTTQNGGTDVFLARLNGNGTALIYSTFLGGAGNDGGRSVALDPTGSVYVGGLTNGGSPSFPTTPGAYQGFVAGGTDGFAAKFGNYTIAGKVVDATTGNPISNVMIALSGQTSGNLLTGTDGRFIFQDTIAGEPYAVSATRAGYSINPAIFNIGALNNNRELVFVGAVGSPTGGSGGTFAFQSLSYNRTENGGAVTLTVKRTGAITEANPVTVDFETVDGTAAAGQDYVATSGVLSFGPLETTKTINVPILNDTILEPRQSFSVVIGNPTNNGDIEIGRETSLVQLLDDDLANGDLLIGEFRERGRLGANDEYVKLYNPHDFDVTVQTADGSGGLTLASAAGAGLTPLATIPNGVTIGAHGYYLLTNNSPNGGFSLIDYPTGTGATTAAGDQTFATDIPDNSDLVLLKTAAAAAFVPANKLDAVGFAASDWSEGKPLAATAEADTEMSYFRRIGADGLRDTDNNAADFLLVDNHARVFGGGDQSRIYAALGAPAPETSESLRLMSAATVTVEESGAESYSSAPVPNGAQGTLTVYRRITNNTAAPLTALRLRAVDFPTLGSELQRRYSSRPDFRLLTSADEGPLVKGVTLAADRLQPNGGGLNSTLGVGAIDAANPLLPGESVVVAIRFGVMRYGRHPLALAVEAQQ